MSNLIAGVDEVGRGPLAGPVVAAAVILGQASIPGLKDSKKLSEKQRNTLCALIKTQATCWAIGLASVEEIDKINILNASLLAMKRAVENLRIKPAKALIDGNRCPELALPMQAIIGGDNLIVEISAASIVAKVTRDAMMVEFEKHYPHHGFAKHKGYGTPEHIKALAAHGITPLHRKSFAPVKEHLLMD